MGATEFTQDKQLTAALFNIHYSTPDRSVEYDLQWFNKNRAKSIITKDVN